MLSKLVKTLQQALIGINYTPTKTQLHDLDFSLSTGKNHIRIRGSHKFIVMVDPESEQHGLRSQTLTATIFDSDAQDYHDKHLRITVDGRKTTIWVCVNERMQSFSDLKEKKIAHSQEDIEAAKNRFNALYEQAQPYLKAPSLPLLQQNLDGLVKLHSACEKCKKLGLRVVNGINIDDILSFTYESKTDAKRILEVYEQVTLSKPKPLSQFGYIQKKGFPESDLSRFGFYPSITERNAAGGLENALAVPLFADLQGRLVGFQSITSDGGKKYHTLKGTKAAGAFALLGALDNYQEGALTLLEGLATGISYALAVPDARVLLTLDTHGLKACTRLFVDRELIHACDNDTRPFPERNKKNAGLESSIKIENELRAEGKQPSIERIAPVGSGFKIDFDDLRQHFNNDFNKLKESLSDTKFVFSQVTSLDDKSNYFTHSRFNDPSFLPDFTSTAAITLSINSPTGSGKTTLLKHITSSVKSAIYVCPRVSLTAQAASDLGLWLYRDLIDTQDKYLPSFESGLKAATTMHSLWKLLEKIESAQDIDCLILDEVDQIFSDLKNIENKETQQRLNGLFSALARAKKVVLLSATMTKPLLDALRAVRPLATNLHIYNTCVKNRGAARVYRGVKAGQVYDKLVRKTAKGTDTIAFSSDRAGNLQKNFDDIKENFPERRALLCTRERFEFSFASDLSEREIESQFLANPDEFLEQYQVDTLFYSPILQTGFSIEKEFDFQFFDYSLDEIQPKSQLQQTMRIRNAKQRLGACLTRNSLNFQTIDDLKKEFVESRKVQLLEAAKEYRYNTYKHSALAAAFEEIAKMIERTAAGYELSEEEEIVFAQIYSDKLEYLDYFETFTNHLKNNGLEVELCEEIEEATTGYVLPKNDIAFEKCVEKFIQDDPEDSFLQAIKKSHTTKIGLRTQRTAAALELAENGIELAHDTLTLEKLTIYKNPKKYLDAARNFLILKDNPFAETYKLAQAPTTQDDARNADGLLGKIAFARELLTVLAAQDDGLLLEFMKNSRRNAKMIKGRRMRIDLLGGLFGFKLKKNEQMTIERAREIANKILGIFGLGLDKILNEEYMAFWEAFTQELKPIFTSELNALFNLKENPFISYSDTENSDYTQASLSYNKSAACKRGNDDGSKSSKFEFGVKNYTKVCTTQTQDFVRIDHSILMNTNSESEQITDVYYSDF